MRTSRAVLVAGGCAGILGAGWAVAPKELPTLDLVAPSSPEASPVASPSVTASPTPASPSPTPTPSLTCEPDDSGDDAGDDKDRADDEDCAVATPSPTPPAAEPAASSVPQPEPEQPAPEEPAPEQPAPEQPAPDPVTSTVDGPVITNARGDYQARVTVTDGRVTDVRAIVAGTDEARSVQINAEAIPLLSQRVLAAQTWDVEHVSGASFTSPAFLESVRVALGKAGL